MTINLAAVLVRSPRRVRLVFTKTLGTGAFTDTLLYEFLNIDGNGVSPDVNAALVVPGAPTNVELALNADLGNGATYTITTDSVPSIDDIPGNPDVSPSETFTFNVGENQTRLNAEPAKSDTELLLYGRDIVWTGLDYLESPTGDLVVVEGVQNAQTALRRRLTANGLPWDGNYGAKARQYVDGVPQTANSLRGALESQALADDRVRQVKATFTLPTDGTPAAFFDVAMQLRGLDTNVSVQVPVK